MATKSTEPGKGEVVIGGTFFPLAEEGHRPGVVRVLDITVRPQKRLEGDITRTSNPNLSNIAFSDFRGGIGLDIMEGNETNRVWEAPNIFLRANRSTTLGPLLERTDAASSPSGPAAALVTFKGDLYASWNADIYKYTPGSDDWGSSLNSLGAGGVSDNVIDGFTFTLGSTEYIAFTSRQGAVNKGYDYSSDGTSWTNDTKNTHLLVKWDDRLWGIGDDGQLWSSFTIGTETDGALLEASKIGSSATTHVPSGMFVGPDAAGEPIIYVVGDTGLWAHDAANEKFIQLNVIPENQSAASMLGLAWRNKIYISSGASLYEYDPINATVRDVGLNNDDGLNEIDPAIQFMAQTPFEIIVFTRSTTNNFGGVFSWTREAWAPLSGIFQQPRGLHANNATLWVSLGANEVYSLPILSNVQDPKRQSGFTYVAAGDLKTPWFHANQVDVDKLAVRLKVETSDTSTSGTVENIKVEYAIDYDEGSSDANYLTLANSTFTDGLIDTDTEGVTQTTFVFPLDTADLTVAPVGKTFRAIRFKVTLTRGATTTNSPRLISMTMEYRKKYERKEGYQFVIDFNLARYKGNTAAKMRSALQTLIESNTLSEFTFRDDAGGTRNIYVDVRIPSAEEETGHLEEGQTLVEVKEL